MGRSNSGRRGVAAVVAGIVAAGGSVFTLFAATTTSAFADSSPYELYCPGTPVGNIVLNGVVTSGTITPANPAAGATFNLTNYQSNVSLPTSIVGAAAALGNSSIAGSAITKIDATGATPATLASGTIAINAPIPSPVPAAGLALSLPATPGSVGPFTASGSTITLTVDPKVTLNLTVSGSNLALTCNPYPNNTAPTGISSSAPAGAPASPVIATSAAGAAPAPTTPAVTAAPTVTTAPPATAPNLATTGPGPHLWLVALVGFIVLYLGSVGLALVERPRSLLRRLLRMGRPAAAGVGPLDMIMQPAPVIEQPVRSVAPQPVVPSVRPVYPKAGGSAGLWFDGWEPDGSTKV